MAIDTDARPSRRNLLAAALGGLTGLLAGRLGAADAAQAATGDPATLGQENTADHYTSFENTTDGSDVPSLYGKHSASGIGVIGTSSSGSAVHGESVTHVGVVGRSTTTTPSHPGENVGVVGVAGDATDVASDMSETGVYGFSNTSATYAVGVWGNTLDGIGVAGTGDWGVFASGNIAVRAIGPIALYTTGKVIFSGRSGHRYVPTGRYYLDVYISGMTSAADVIAVLRTRKTGYFIAAVASYTGKFRVYLNKTATSAIYFNYLVLN